MGIFGRRLLKVVIIMLATVALATSARAATFTKASVKGTYGFMTVLSTANPKTTTFGMVGAMVFDGAGHLTAAYTSNSGGVVKTGTWGGTYSVNSDGTGGIDITTGGNATFAITLNSTAAGVAHGLQMLLIDDSNNEVVSGTATLQSAAKQTYSVASLKGNYAILGNSWTAAANDKQEGVTGILTFDGKGNGTALATVMWGGALLGPKSQTFTYAVNSNGIGSVLLAHGAHWAFALNSVAAGQAEGLQFLVTVSTDLDNGSLVLEGTAVAQ